MASAIGERITLWLQIYSTELGCRFEVLEGSMLIELTAPMQDADQGKKSTCRIEVNFDFTVEAIFQGF